MSGSEHIQLSIMSAIWCPLGRMSQVRIQYGSPEMGGIADAPSRFRGWMCAVPMRWRRTVLPSGAAIVVWRQGHYVFKVPMEDWQVEQTQRTGPRRPCP
jgi:hypothetical protein